MTTNAKSTAPRLVNHPERPERLEGTGSRPRLFWARRSLMVPAAAYGTYDFWHSSFILPLYPEQAPPFIQSILAPGTSALWHRSSQGLPPRPVHVVQLLPAKVRVLDPVESTAHRLIFRDVCPANLTAKALLG